MKIPLLQLSLLSSVVLHGALLCVIKAKSVGLAVAHPQAYHPAVVVSLHRAVPSQASQNAKEMGLVVASSVHRKVVDSRITTENILSSSTQFAEIGVGEQALQEERVEENQNAENRKSLPLLPQQNQIDFGKKPENSVPQIVQEMLSPCQLIRLPEHWLSRGDFLPRRYKFAVSFATFDDSQAPFNELHLQPDSDPLPFADNYIEKAFVNCVRKLDTAQRLAMRASLQALNPEPGKAYSIKIEFLTAHSPVSLPQGI